MIICIALLVFLLPFWVALKVMRLDILAAVLVAVLVICLLLFFYLLDSYDKDYFELADGIYTNYTPFALKHAPTLFIFSALAFIALIVLCIKKRALPPLLLVTVLSLIFIGSVISVAVIIQTIGHDQDGSALAVLPIMYLVVSLIQIVRLILAEASLAANRNYRQPWLNRLNNFMAKAPLQPFLVLALAIPLFLVITLILVIFGQDTHAITKVFTDTSTWHFSTKTHPPYIDHRGHYLCTVAASGSPAVVKPLGWGYRHGYPIVVNRQLQIANAFEELIQQQLPALHRIIRKNYDRHGYPLSKKINSQRGSNITYYLMKPLEYFSWSYSILAAWNLSKK